jgi:RNA polymerase sigma-70 factor (ECF subfamily)
MKVERGEFERLALAQLDTLYRVARRLVRDPSAAEDLVQETYVRALRARESFSLEEYGIRPWLLRILHNLHVNRTQREGRQPQAMEEEHLAAAASVTPSQGLPIDPKSWEGMDQELVRAMEALPSEYSSVLTLWAVEDLSYKEISQALEIPIGTVMSRLHRARQKLSEQLRPYATREGILRE